MLPLSHPTHENFISLTQACALAPYSRDYISRLARSGRIVGRQVDKQWLILESSLVNFYEHSTLEDSVKKRILSQSRKNDLEVKDFYQAKLSTIQNLSLYSGNASLLLATVIMSAGLLSGLLLSVAADINTVTPAPTLASGLRNMPAALMSAFSATPKTVAYQPLFTADRDWSQVTETQEKILMKGGVVLFPANATSGVQNVIELFSDEVVVTMTSTTTGAIKLIDSDTTLPFVRIPNVAPQ